MQRMILFTIGSVQNFIINSRKTKDLENASNIISDLVTKALLTLKEKYQGQIILPFIPLESINKDCSLCPNYFIATYENETSAGKELADVVNREFSRENLNLLLEKKIDPRLIEQIRHQLETALDIYWCETPVNSDKRDCIELLYEQLEAMKNIKNVTRLEEPEGEKCNICGVRNAIFYTNSVNESVKRQREYTYTKDNSIYGSSIYEVLKQVSKADAGYVYKKNDFEEELLIKNVDTDKDLNCLKEGEYLCGVCFLKRLKKNDGSILSLSGYALRDWLKRIDPKDHIKNSICSDSEDKYQEIFKLWEEDPGEIRCSLKIPEGKQLPKPPTYYCLYRMDIDDLGRTMRKADYLKDLSQVIYDFFERVVNAPAEMEKTVKIVYAGGDDLLALMSIESSFDFAKKVKENFHVTIASKYPNLTYSQGLFFAHHKSPFSEVLRLSKDMLEQVKTRYKKSVPEKNGTVVSVLTEGFSDQSVFFKNDGILNLERFKKIMDYFKNVSSYFHHDLGKEFLNLADTEDLDIHTFLNMLFLEQERLMRRKIDANKKDGDKIKTEMLDIKNILEIFMYQSCFDVDRINLTNYFNLFAIIKKLNSQQRGDIIE